MVDVAVVGAGAWGRNHVRTFAAAKGARLVAVCDANGAALERAAAVAPSAALVDDFEALLRRDDVQAVVLATPAIAHAAQARAALLAGKDVLVEKPMAMSVSDAEALCELADKEGRVLMVGHLLRYHPGVRKLFELVENGELGELLYAYSVRVNLGRLRQDENALWSLAPHDFSLLLPLMGGAPESVAARGGAYLQAGIEDVVFVNLRFSNGRSAQVHVSWLDPRKDRRLTIVGSRKMAVFDDTEPTEVLRIHDKGFDKPPEFGTYGEFLAIRQGEVRVPFIEAQEPLAVEAAHFIDCVASRRTPLTSGADGLSVVRVLEAAQRSLERDGMPLRV